MATAFDGLLGHFQSAVNAESVPRVARAQRWVHIAITPDVELNVRNVADAETLGALVRIADHVRYLLLRPPRSRPRGPKSSRRRTGTRTGRTDQAIVKARCHNQAQLSQAPRLATTRNILKSPPSAVASERPLNNDAGALWDLGATRDEIAHALKANGIVARRRSPNECPVAHYLRRNLGLRGVQVLGDVVTELLKNNDASVVLPRAVRKFVAWFDAGAYTELAIPSQ